MNVPNKTIAYFVAFLVPPLGVYLAVGMPHQWRRLALIMVSALLTMAYSPLGLVFAVLIIYTRMPDEAPPAEEETTPAGAEAAEPVPAVNEAAPAVNSPPQPIPGLAVAGAAPQPLPGLEEVNAAAPEAETAPSEALTEAPVPEGEKNE